MRAFTRSTGKTLTAAACCTALTACALSGVTVSRVDYAHQYSPLEVSAAGVLPVAVHGNPFNASDDTLKGSVIEAMQGSTFGIPVRFIPAPDRRDPEQRFHVVLAFAPPGGASPGALCAAEGDSIPATTTKSGMVNLLGAFCSKDSFLSHAIARAEDVPGPDSEKLDAIVSQLTLSLFPNRNPHSDNSDPPGGVLPLN